MITKNECVLQLYNTRLSRHYYADELKFHKFKLKIHTNKTYENSQESVLYIYMHKRHKPFVLIRHPINHIQIPFKNTLNHHLLKEELEKKTRAYYDYVNFATIVLDPPEFLNRKLYENHYIQNKNRVFLFVSYQFKLQCHIFMYSSVILWRYIIK